MTRPVTSLVAMAIVLIATAIGVLLRKLLILWPLMRRSTSAGYGANRAPRLVRLLEKVDCMGAIG